MVVPRLLVCVAVVGGNFALSHRDTTSGGGVAIFAHIGGFVFGLIVAIALSGAGRITLPQTRWYGR